MLFEFHHETASVAFLADGCHDSLQILDRNFAILMRRIPGQNLIEMNDKIGWRLGFEQVRR